MFTESLEAAFLIGAIRSEVIVECFSAYRTTDCCSLGLSEECNDMTLEVIASRGGAEFKFETGYD